jgi:hypothetical protein
LLALFRVKILFVLSSISKLYIKAIAELMHYFRKTKLSAFITRKLFLDEPLIIFNIPYPERFISQPFKNFDLEEQYQKSCIHKVNLKHWIMVVNEV